MKSSRLPSEAPPDVVVDEGPSIQPEITNGRDVNSAENQPDSKSDLDAGVAQNFRPSSFRGGIERYFCKLDSNLAKNEQAVPASTTVEKTLQPALPNTNPKRKATAAVATSSPAKKLTRTSSKYAPPTKYAHLVNKLTDSLAPNLICVFIGLNPGIQTAVKGHAYSHRSNLFWKLLHTSGCTPRLCRPEEDGDMPKLYELGFTNIVSRPTKDGSELSKDEMDAGVAELDMKASLHRPEAVAIVGKSIWESIWRVRHRKNIKKEEFKYGWQDDNERMGTVLEGEHAWPGARVFVATSTSGLAVTLRPHEKEEIWRRLGQWVEKRRTERELEDVETKPETRENKS